MRPFRPLSYICPPGLLLLFCFCPAVAEETIPQQSAPQTRETHAAQEQTPPAAGEKAADRARASFDTFTHRWMQKLVETEDFQKKKRMNIRQTQEGFIAEYTGYLPYRYTTIKLTRSKATPFVGILTYYKKTMRSVGKTRKQALNGQFEHAETSQVSEIFRYTKGEWVY